jgi:hypothetical protein
MAMCVTSRVAVRLISWAIASAVIGEAQVSFESFIVSILVTWHGEGNGEGSAPRGEKAACTATLPPQPGGCVGVGAGIGCRRREGGFSPCAPMLHAPCSMLHAPCSMLHAPCSMLHAPTTDADGMPMVAAGTCLRTGLLPLAPTACGASEQCGCNWLHLPFLQSPTLAASTA